MKSPKELPMILDLVLNKCSLLIQKKTEIINMKYNEVIIALKQKNLDLAKLKMGNLIKFEKNIEAIIILKPILERIQKNCASMLSKKECPISLRPPLDSVLYASVRLQLEDLKQFREIIIQMYGRDYVKIAINNEDKIANQDLISKLKEANLTEATIKERLTKVIKELQAKANNTNSAKKEEKDIFGGDTVGNTIILNPQPSENIPIDLITRLNIDDNNSASNTDKNQIFDTLGGNTVETMHLSVANPDNKTNPYEETLDELFGTTIQQISSGRTLGLDKSLKIAKGGVIDPFDKKNKDKIKDPFAVDTIELKGEEENLKKINKGEEIKPISPNFTDNPFDIPTIIEEKLNNESKEGPDPFDTNIKIKDPFGGDTI